MKENPIAIWNLEDQIEGMNMIDLSLYNKQSFPNLKIRTGFEEILDNLAKNHNFQHFGFTSYSQDIKNETIKDTKIDKHFSEIISSEDTPSDFYSFYIKKLGLSKKDAYKRVIAVANKRYQQQPIDIPGLVFIALDATTNQSFQDLFPIEPILTHLWQSGEGDFKTGYENLLQTARINPYSINTPFPIYENFLPNHPIYFLMQYFQTYFNQQTADPYTCNPTIYLPRNWINQQAKKHSAYQNQADMAQKIRLNRPKYDLLLKKCSQYGTEIKRDRCLEKDIDIPPYNFVRKGDITFAFPHQDSIVPTIKRETIDENSGYSLTYETSNLKLNKSNLTGLLTINYTDSGSELIYEVKDLLKRSTLPPEILAEIKKSFKIV